MLENVPNKEGNIKKPIFIRPVMEKKDIMFGPQHILILEELKQLIVSDNIHDHNDKTATVEVRHNNYG